MLYQKDGLPEESELVLCSVTNVQHHSVFVRLEEYGKSGMIHISEISPGRIRNIRDYVVEGKVIVCKVLRINKERGHIDLSLRRVSEGQRREKVNEIKHEQKAEKIIEFVARALKSTKEKIFEEIQGPIFENYPTVYSCFENVIVDEKILSKIGISTKLEKKLVETIKQRIKPPVIVIQGKISISSYESDGVNRVISVVEKLDTYDDVKITYLGGGLYSFSITDEDYKSAEKKIKKILSEMEKVSSKNKCNFSFVRADK